MHVSFKRFNKKIKNWKETGNSSKIRYGSWRVLDKTRGRWGWKWKEEWRRIGWR